MKKLLLNLTFTILLLSVAYSQCDESNWEEYYPYMQDCNLSGADLSGANLEGACLEGAIAFTQTNYNGTPILEGCAASGGGGGGTSASQVAPQTPNQGIGGNSPTTKGGGGTGSGYAGPPGSGGDPTNNIGEAGEANTGGGAGGQNEGRSGVRDGLAGGSGIVVIRYKYPA